jgi:hypothetical protein
MPPRFEHEHDDEHEDDLVADLGVSSVERYAALCLCGELLLRELLGREFGRSYSRPVSLLVLAIPGEQDFSTR